MANQMSDAAVAGRIIGGLLGSKTAVTPQPNTAGLAARDLSLEERAAVNDAIGYYKNWALPLSYPPPVERLGARDVSLEERSNAGEGAKDFFSQLGLGILGSLGKREAEALLDAHYAQYAELPEGQDLQARDLSLEERGLGPLGFITAIPEVMNIVKDKIAPLINKGQNPPGLPAQTMQSYPPQAGAGSALPGAIQGRPALAKRNDGAKIAGSILGSIFGMPIKMLTGGLASTAGGGATQALPQAPQPPQAPQALAPQAPAPPATGKPSRRSRVRRDNQDPASLSLKRAAAVLGALNGLTTVPYNNLAIPANPQDGAIGAPNQPASGAVLGNPTSGGILGKRAEDAVDSGPVLERCANGCSDEGHTSITTSVSVPPTVMLARDDAAVTPAPAFAADDSLHERYVPMPNFPPSTLQTSVKGKTGSKKPKHSKTTISKSKPCTRTSTVPGASRSHGATGHRNPTHGGEVTITKTVPAKPHLPTGHGTAKHHGSTKPHPTTKPHGTSSHHGNGKPHPTTKPHGTSSHHGNGKPHSTSKPHGTNKHHGATTTRVGSQRPDSHPATQTEVVTKTVLVTGHPTQHRSSKEAKPTSTGHGSAGTDHLPLPPIKGPKRPVEERDDSESHEVAVEQRDDSDNNEGKVEQRDDSDNNEGKVEQRDDSDNNEGKVEQRDDSNEPVEQ